MPWAEPLWRLKVTDPISAEFRKPFQEQIAAYRLRLGNLVPTQKWDDIRKQAHNRAFMVAGAAKADLLADLALAVDKAVSQGTSLDEFRKDFRSIVEKRGWHGWTGEDTKAGRAWRTRVIYRTNMRTSYAAGRYAQLVEGNFPIWIYRHGGSLEPRVQHLAWDGLMLPPDHDFWKTHGPPNGWGCSCYVTGARSKTSAQRRGGDPDKRLPDNWNAPATKTGTPEGIDQGWDYAPGLDVTDTVRLAGEQMSRMPLSLASEFGSSVERLVEMAWPIWIADVRAGRSNYPGFVGRVAIEDANMLASVDQAPQDLAIYVRPGLDDGPKAALHEAKGDALDLATWSALSTLMRKPRAVLYDQVSGNLLYLVERNGAIYQIAVAIGRTEKAQSLPNIMNSVISAYRIQVGDLRTRINRGTLTVVRGKVG